MDLAVLKGRRPAGGASSLDFSMGLSAGRACRLLRPGLPFDAGRGGGGCGGTGYEVIRSKLLPCHFLK